MSRRSLTALTRPLRNLGGDSCVGILLTRRAAARLEEILPLVDRPLEPAVVPRSEPPPPPPLPPRPLLPLQATAALPVELLPFMFKERVEGGPLFETYFWVKKEEGFLFPVRLTKGPRAPSCVRGRLNSTVPLFVSSLGG